MSFGVYFAVAVSLVLAGFALTSLIASRRRNKAYEKLARTATFHCLRCDSVYTGEADSELRSCPKCGYKNTRLRF